MSSAIAAALPDGNGPAKDLHYRENRLRACGTTLTALRACYLQDNVASALTPATQAGIFPNFLPSADFVSPMIATQDVGRFAAAALTTAYFHLATKKPADPASAAPLAAP